jgi:hypothetical protein
VKLLSLGAVLTVAITVAALYSVDGCSKPETAKDAYYIESQNCITANSAAVAQLACLNAVRAAWTEAGAAPAASITVTSTDAGGQ